MDDSTSKRNVVRAVHPEKALEPIVSTAGKCADSKAIQNAKA